MIRKDSFKNARIDLHDLAWDRKIPVDLVPIAEEADCALLEGDTGDKHIAITKRSTNFDFGTTFEVVVRDNMPEEVKRVMWAAHIGKAIMMQPNENEVRSLSTASVDYSSMWFAATLLCPRDGVEWVLDNYSENYVERLAYHHQVTEKLALMALKIYRLIN